MKRSGFSKDVVYKRLLKNAAEIWNIHESDLDSMDPLAKMLLGSTAKEIERIGNELYSSDARIFKRLAQFLLPDELQTAAPSHGIVQMDPVENTEVTRFDEMYYEKKWKNKTNLNKIESADIMFSSAGDYPMNNSKLAYRAQGGRLFHTDGIRQEEVADLNSSIPDREIYLGFRLAHSVSKEFRLYFDWLNLPNKKSLFLQLPKLRIYDSLQNNLEVSAGIKENEDSFDLKSSVKGRSKLEEKVVNYYNERFMRFSLKEDFESQTPSFLVAPLEECGETRPEEILWLKLDFPPDLEKEELKEMLILDNCIPVLNRKLEKSIFRLHKNLNINRLEFNNFFLEVERAESSKGVVYHGCPSLELTEMDSGSYNIRLGGTGRLDERDGYEYLNYLLDMLRDEKQSFAALDVTATITDLKTIEQVLQKVKKKVADSNRGSKQPYIIVKPHSESENAHIYFWSTDGDMGNRIPINSKLRCRNPGLTSSGYQNLVTQTVGGGNEKASKQMIQSYKSALLSRGMVVTNRDIVELCKVVAGDRLNHVQIKNGIMTSSEQGSGLIPTLDVFLKFSFDLKDEHEKQHLRQQIESELTASSNFAKPLRVLIV